MNQGSVNSIAWAIGMCVASFGAFMAWGDWSCLIVVGAAIIFKSGMNQN